MARPFDMIDFLVGYFGGVVFCTISTFGVFMVVIVFTFRFIAPPEILPLSNATVTKGENITIECFASGLPSPVVAWLRDGEVLPGQMVSTFRFVNA